MASVAAVDVGSSTNMMSHRNGELSSVPGDLLVGVLATDTRACVSIIDRRHVLVWANDNCKALPTDPSTDIIGRYLAELLPERVAEERIALIDEAFETMCPVRVQGMLGGTWANSAYLPFKTSDGEPRVLIVTSDQAETHLQPRSRGAQDARRARHDDWRHLDCLTDREREVLRLLGFGLSTREIAERLHRSVKTVQSHREALGAKLGVHNKSELARLAVCSGLTAVEAETALGS